MSVQRNPFEFYAGQTYRLIFYEKMKETLFTLKFCFGTEMFEFLICMHLRYFFPGC